MRTIVLSARIAANYIRRTLHSSRMASTSAGLVDLSVDNEGFAIVTLQSPPVNALNLKLMQDLIEALDYIDKTRPRGMILTSALPKVLCAGLDLKEINGSNKEALTLYWTTIQNLWLNLFGSKFITAVAINGHAPGGGCILTMSCEYRAMVTGKCKIGLNETPLGLVASPWLMDTMSYIIPQRDAERAITLGKLFNAEEALKIGLIDEVTTDKKDAIEKCKEFIKLYDNIPYEARGITKLRMRSRILAWFGKNREADLKYFETEVNKPSIQQLLKDNLRNFKENKNI